LLSMPWGGHRRFCEHSTHMNVMTLRMTFPRFTIARGCSRKRCVSRVWGPNVVNLRDLCKMHHDDPWSSMMNLWNLAMRGCIAFRCSSQRREVGTQRIPGRIRRAGRLSQWCILSAVPIHEVYEITLLRVIPTNGHIF
jgi:hypothetical protein